MSIVGNSKIVFEKRYNDAYKMIQDDYNQHYKKDYDKVLSIIDGLIEKNQKFVTQIYNEKNSLINYEKLLEKREALFKKWKKK